MSLLAPDILTPSARLRRPQGPRRAGRLSSGPSEIKWDPPSRRRTARRARPALEPGSSCRRESGVSSSCSRARPARGGCTVERVTRPILSTGSAPFRVLRTSAQLRSFFAAADGAQTCRRSKPVTCGRAGGAVRAVGRTAPAIRHCCADSGIISRQDLSTGEGVGSLSSSLRFLPTSAGARTVPELLHLRAQARPDRERFDEIVSFAELEHAIDRPVTHLLVGDVQALGFAIAAHLPPTSAC